MRVHDEKDFTKRTISDALVVPFWKKGNKVLCACHFPEKEKVFRLALESGDFEAENGQILWMYTDDVQEKRIAMLGLGASEKVDNETLRRAYGAMFQAGKSIRGESLGVIFPDTGLIYNKEVLKAILEGILLSKYSYTQKSSVESSFKKELQDLYIIECPAHVVAISSEVDKVIQGVNLARDLVNANADDVTPEYLGTVATSLAVEHSTVQTQVYGREWIEEKKMGLFSAVTRGSFREPKFIVVQYKRDPREEDHIVFVGKGITYDTGGLNLKVAPNSMLEMKCDMGGAATVLGIMKAVALLDLPVNITGVIAACENSIGPKSYKPGDVYTSLSGKTVEIVNTDAEGRLTLADALYYTAKVLRPTCIIDFATLTGGMEIALGREATGLMANSDILANNLIEAGNRTFERIWRLPLYPEYKEFLSSDIADLKNVSLKRSAVSIVAGMFLQEFIDGAPWAHLDIASTAYIQEPKHYLPKYATGVGVRMIVEYLQKICRERK